jgi:thioredoxin reductase (NADPH)
MENVIILGSGIAGLTAAIYSARAGLNPLIISGPADGGQLMLTNEVENFPGFPEGLTGPELVDKCRKQAERFGTRFQIGTVTKVEKKSDQKSDQKSSVITLTIDNEKTIETKTLIIATGATARWLGIPSEEKFKGRGISTCATCDGAFFKGKEVVIVGGGDVAMEEALFMTRLASKVSLVHRRDEFRASKIMAERVLKNKSINIIYNKEVNEVLGDKTVESLKLKDTKTGEISEIKCEGLFLAIGHIPNTKFLAGCVKLNEAGYLEANPDMHTNIPGIFAAGDVYDFKWRQAVTAAGTGCAAALEAEKYLSENE